jgi:hypothetical protein
MLTAADEAITSSIIHKEQMLSTYQKLVEISVSANGDGASDLQVSVAALSIYWMVQLVTA